MFSDSTTASTYKTTILSDHPLAYYRLDESSGTTVADSSGHNRTGTITGTPSHGVAGALAGDPDTAMGFNGTNSWITAAAPAVGSTYSLEAWVKTQSYQGHIIDISPQQLIFQSGKFKFGTGSHYLLSASATYGDNQYHHVVATFDGTTKRLYVDGVLVGSLADSVGTITGSTVFIANFYEGGGLFTGSLDEVAVYGVVLSATQVANHYNAGRANPTPTPTPSGLVTETGTVHQVNPYGTSPPSEQVDIYPGSPYNAIDCYSTSAAQFSVGQQVVCVGTYVNNGVNQWINATSLTLASSSPTPAPTPTPTATATAKPSPTPTPSPTSTTAGVMKHVLTSDYVLGPGTRASPSILAPYLNWAETPVFNNTAVRAAGIKAMLYSDPNRQAPGDPLYTSDESTFAHTCSGARIQGAYSQYLMDPSSSSLRTLWKNWIAAQSIGLTWDAILEDNANDVLNLSTLPCNYSADSWLTASQGLNSAQAPTPIIYSGLVISNEKGLNVSSNVIGGMEEGCYSSAVTRPKIWSNYWTPIENNEIAMAQQVKLFMCYGNDTTSASSSADGRLYTYASFLLTYAPTLSILWEHYGTTSGFHVMPESRLVALNPVLPTPSDISGLKLSSGVYGREYAHCYIGGASVGECAAVVNADRTYAHAYPYGTKYGHTLVISGSGIIDGGSISTTGPAPPATLGNLEAVIVFK